MNEKKPLKFKLDNGEITLDALIAFAIQSKVDGYDRVTIEGAITVYGVEVLLN